MLVLFAVMVAVAPAALADNVTVGCAGSSGTFDYTSLSDALAAVSHNGDTITVSGTCTELVVIGDFNNLTIIGTAGASVVEPLGGNPQGDVVDITDSQNVLIQSLRVQAVAHTPETAIPVVAIANSSVTFRDSTIQGSTQTDGLNVFPTSNVSIVGGSVIENNPDGAGVFATGSGASVNIFRGGPLDAPCPLIRNNGDGLDAFDNASIAVRQCATIRDNIITAGVAAFNGGTVIVINPQATPGSIQILNNAIGVLAAQGSRLRVSGPVLIEGNTLDGVRVRSSSVGTINGGPTITGNGGGGFVCCAVPAGVSVAVNSTLELQAATITNNPAAGVHLTDNASARVFGENLTISGNQGGVVLQNSSTALLFFAPSLTGNGSDLSCTSDSRAYGDGSAIGRMNCPSFQAQSNPAMGSQGKIVP
jgi:hypothetical protein